MQIPDWLQRGSELHPARIVIEDGEDGRQLSYAMLNMRASQLARFLLESKQLIPGSRVAILSRNRPEYIEALYGCAKAGMILVCLNWRLAPEELLAVAADCTPSLLLFETDFEISARAIAEAHSECALLPLEAADGYERELSAINSNPLEMPVRSADDVWHLLYTSGTTGRPKGVLQTFGMVFSNAVNALISGKVVPGDQLLNVLPFFHTGGLNLYANAVIMTGGTVIIQRQFDPAAVIARLNRDVTSFFAVPAIYLALVGHPSFASARFSSVRNFSVGGAPIPSVIGEAFAAKGAVIAPSYGMTEAGPTIFAADIATAARKPLSVGKAVGLACIRIVDANGADVEPMAEGELLLGGSVVTPGYWNRPDATSEAIHDGWIRTGDMARRDADGDVYIVDRKKDMYISGGENVYPAEVENVLHALPGVAEAAVIGVPDAQWGEVGVALIVMKPDFHVSETEILRACEGRLARYKIPRLVRMVDQLPRTPSGKVEKHRLRASINQVHWRDPSNE